MVPLPKPYMFGENEWKEKYLGDEKCMPKTYVFGIHLCQNVTLCQKVTFFTRIQPISTFWKRKRIFK